MLTTPVPGPHTPRYLFGFDLRRRPHLDADVLVVGGGVAGLCAALAAADAGQVGVAAVLRADEREPADSLELHVQDTLVAGSGLCDEPAVRDILDSAESAIDVLRSHGCVFDGKDHVSLTREGGHSARRILHANGDSTGQEVVRSLVAAASLHPSITIIDQAFAVDLLTDGGRVMGVLYYRRSELCTALAGETILATGGCGRVWREVGRALGRNGSRIWHAPILPPHGTWQPWRLAEG